MGSASILHVGPDHCHRIPVMEHIGLEVFTSDCSVEGIDCALDGDRIFSAIAFTNAFQPVPDAVISTARGNSTSPLILFKSPFVEYDEEAFALIISDDQGPRAWLKSLKRLIDESRRIQEFSKQLRAESAATRAKCQELRAKLAQTEIDLIGLADRRRGGQQRDLNNRPDDGIPPSDRKSRR